MSDYKDTYYPPVSRERDCGVLHQTIEEAIVHAEQHLGCFRKPMMPYRGTTRENEGVIVGFAISHAPTGKIAVAPARPRGRQ
jgi:hypothetical protein